MYRFLQLPRPFPSSSPLSLARSRAAQTRPGAAVSNAARAAQAGLILLASACSGYESTSYSGREENGGYDPRARFAEPAACGAYSHPACDVLDAGCQGRLAEIAACQFGGRETPAVLPPIDTVTRMEYRDQLGMSSLEMGDSASAAEGFEVVLMLLGLAEMGTTASETAVEANGDLTLAFYNAQTDRITLLADARTGNDAADDGVLLHELIHAQQDARYDLGALTPQDLTIDAAFALRSLVEGEATFHEYIFRLGMLGVPSDPMTFQRLLDAVRTDQENLAGDSAGLWVRSLLLLPYTFGPYWILRQWFEGGASGMPDHYAELPGNSLTMLQAVFGRTATSSGIWPFPSTNIYYAPGTPAPVEGDEGYPIGIDRMGAWTVYVLAELLGGEPADLALGWRGDQVDVFELDSGGFAGRFRVGFDTAAHATQFAALLSQNPSAQVRSQGNLVVVTVSEGATPDWLFAPL